MTTQSGPVGGTLGRRGMLLGLTILQGDEEAAHIPCHAPIESIGKVCIHLLCIEPSHKSASKVKFNDDVIILRIDIITI